ncbi:MAG: hypothetical protein RLZZ381_3834 [Cyanobacteriota bacterium]
MVNAIDQAKSLEMISKIEAIVHLFRSQFPNSLADLKPWSQNAETAKFENANSIDIGFHFSKLDFPCQCRSILMQVRLERDFESEQLKAIGVELSGYETSDQLWEFSTIGNWQFWGDFPPTIRTQEKLKQVCYQIIKLFSDN